MNCSNCDAMMTCDHQCEPQDTDSSWEDIESEQEDEQKLYPTNQPTNQPNHLI